MSIKKIVVLPLIVAVLAFTIQIVDQLLSPVMKPFPNSGFCWIAFQAWAVYFLAGGNVKGGLKSLVGYAVGISGSILIMNMAGWFGSLQFFAVPLAVGLVACVLLFLGNAPWWISFIPSMFIGAGAFFAFMSYIPGATFTTAAVTEIVYCIIGLFYGWATLTLQPILEKWVGK